MLTAASLVIAPNWKVLPAEKWINKTMVHTDNGIYSGVKSNELLIHTHDESPNNYAVGKKPDLLYTLSPQKIHSV